jgi:hypothetical protein
MGKIARAGHGFARMILTQLIKAAPSVRLSAAPARVK